MSWISLSFRWSLVLLFALAAMSSTFAKQANAKTLAKKNAPSLKGTQHCNNVYFYEAPNKNIVKILQEIKQQLSQVEKDIKILKGKKTSGKTWGDFDSHN